MRTILEIKDIKANLLEENDKLIAAREAEKRGFTKEEEIKFSANLTEVKNITLQLTSEALKQDTPEVRDIVMKVGPKREPFSLIDAINAVAEKRDFSDVANDIFTLGRQQMRHATGTNLGGSMVIPLDASSIIESRADILAQTATAGQEIVKEDKMSILPPLTSKLLLSQLGATYMGGLVGDVSIPTYAGTTVAWKTEVAIATDGGAAFSEVLMQPCRITAFIDISKTFLAQDGVGAEALLMSNIVNAVARHIEATIFGEGISVAAQQPGSFGYQLIGTHAGAVVEAAPTFAKMVTMESTVDASNALQGNMSYITSPKGRGILKSIDKGVANDTGEMLCEDNMVNGYPLHASSSVTDTAGTNNLGSLVIFGNWADVIIGQWGGYDITVDPYTQAINNQVKIVINTFVNVRCLRGIIDEAGANTEYFFPVAFSVLPITA